MGNLTLRRLSVASLAVAAFAVATPAFAECSGYTKAKTQSITKPLTTTDSGVITPIGTKAAGPKITGAKTTG